ncbi:MAG: hypothetical protein MJ224_02635 [archaeon]|nr:hypothetical protein [archaeon]
MNKKIIKYSHINYLSDIPNFELPNGIFNKVVTGIGGTTLALESKYPYIIASPRVKLIENKAEQYPNALVIKNGVTKSDIDYYLSTCTTTPKILTTFDSFKKINVDKSEFRVLVDELQVLLSDSSFKGFVDMEFLKEVDSYKYVTYMSATVDEDLIQQVSYFANKDYYILDIPTDKIKIQHHLTAKPELAIIDIINNYLQNPYIQNNHVSNEVIFFINSVSTICSLIKETKLSSKDVNIIVADTEENNELISKLGKKFSNGRIPLKGEKSKKFTFCTSTAFCGCDFYSDNAIVVVMMNSRKRQTILNPYDQLSQIAGRLRNNNNPFRKEIHLIYDNNFKLIKSEEEFNKEEEEMEFNTKSDLANYNSVAVKDRFMNTWKGELTSYLVKIDNKFVDNQLKRFYRKSQHNLEKQLSDGLLVNLIDNTTLLESGDLIRQSFNGVFHNIIKRGNFQTEMKAYIEAYKTNNKNELVRIASKFPKIPYYYNKVGENKIKTCKYIEKNIIDYIDSTTKQHTISFLNVLKQKFKIGIPYTKVMIKDNLQNVYNSLGIKKTAKAVELLMYIRYYESTTTINNKRLKTIIIKDWI